MTQYIKNFNKTQKSPIKPIKPQKNTRGFFFLIKPGFLPALYIASRYLNQRWRPTCNTAGILAPVKVIVERLRCMILSNDTKHA